MEPFSYATSPPPEKVAMASPLAQLFSMIESAKRYAGDAITSPLASFQRGVGQLGDEARTGELSSTLAGGFNPGHIGAPGAMAGIIKGRFGSFDSPVDSKLLDMVKNKALAGEIHNPVILPEGDKFAVVIDGHVIDTHDNLTDAVEANRLLSYDPEFWRGEISDGTWRRYLGNQSYTPQTPTASSTNVPDVP